jgi:hypothetical protein
MREHALRLRRSGCALAGPRQNRQHAERQERTPTNGKSCQRLAGGSTDRDTQLLDLDPPLETVIVDEYEDVYPEKTAKLIRDVRDGRDKDPRTAMLSFGELLKRIRNKRAHGFKSRKGSRDVQILSATRAVLASLLDALL